MAELYFNEKTFNKKIAKIDGVQAALEVEAQARAAVARGVLSAHRDTGKSFIEVTSGKVDRYVSLVDPGGNAFAVEFGRDSETRINRVTGQEYTISASQGVAAITTAFRGLIRKRRKR